MIMHTREIGSRYSDILRAGRSLDGIPVGQDFLAPVQTGSGAHLASYYNGYRFSFPEVKRPERSVNHPSHLALRLNKK